MLRIADRRFAVLAAVGTAVAYYLGARVGTAFTASAEPISVLWPPNAILLGALLCTPRVIWPIILFAALPAHLAVELNSGVPLRMVLSWFVSNSTEALFGAACIRWFIAPPVRFDSFRRVIIFVTFGAFLAPFLSSFLDVALVQWNGWTFNKTYSDLWRVRFFSNVLAVLTIVPVMVPWERDGIGMGKVSSLRRRIEAACLAAAVILLCTLAFEWRPPAALTAPLLLGVALPCLFWSAVRFGPRGAGICLFALNILSIVWALKQRGLFVTGSDRDNVFSLQLFLIGIYVPIMALAAVIRERARAEHDTRRNEEWLNTVLRAAKMGTWSLDLETQIVRLSAGSRQLLGFGSASSVTDSDPYPAALTREEHACVAAAATHRRAHCAVRDGVPSNGRLAQRWILSPGDVVNDDDGRPVRVVGVHADITERKLAEAVLRDEIEARSRVERAPCF
jgi:integral membrane sensor domain MASE1